MKNITCLFIFINVVSVFVSYGQKIQNIIYIEQVGPFQELRLKQAGLNNESFFIQEGNNNILIHFQEGNNNQTFVLQYGSGNLFKLKQIGEHNLIGSKDYYFEQRGNGNKFAGVDYNQSFEFAEGNFAEQFQGAKLAPESFQNGDENIIGLQQGIGDMSLIQQTGNENGILLWQNGGGNYAVILQNGDRNHVRTIQK
jgi:hypothetical protein